MHDALRARGEWIQSAGHGSIGVSLAHKYSPAMVWSVLDESMNRNMAAEGPHGGRKTQPSH